IKDILAGIFIIFESEFRVGDIVTINGFRGTVTDIGLRTTKISGGGNVKIYNNSEISGVLNMTKETSVAAATIGLEYGQDIDYVEEVLNRELPILKEENKHILDGPTNLGVSELAERRYTVTVIARCSEQNVRDTNRFLNKALLQIFARNGIRIANQSKDTVKKDVPTETIK
ncbi:MAG: mechanosensitive ion channel family protein, partial [Erysipelotrichaceae bacterium]|nr:mechanosensitive ion channel family protein [Erysipelotrichaceae bacterium]